MKITRTTRAAALFAMLGALLTVFGCGYHFSARGTLKNHIKQLYIKKLVNRTGEVGLDQTITNALVYELIKHSIKISSIPDNAGVLEGEIVSANISTISRLNTHAALERRVTVTIHLLLRNENNQVVWNSPLILSEQTYAVGSDKIATDQNRKRALIALARLLAESVYDQLTLIE